MSGQLLGPAAAMPPVAIAQPLNDVQLLALVAANLITYDGAKQAVDLAVEITAHAGLAVNSGALGRRLRELIAEAQKPDEPASSATA